MFRKIRTNFFTGLLIVTPLVLTFWVFYFIISKLNLLLLEPLMNTFGKWAPGQNIEALIKIAIFFLLIGLVVLAGFATRVIILRNIFGFGEKILYRVPMIRTIYGSLKELSFAFLGTSSSIFKRVVLVEYPRKGLYAIGFITSEAGGEAQEKTKEHLINVFLPTTPNPTSGMFLLVPEQDIIPLDMSVRDGMKLIISGGAVGPNAQVNPQKLSDVK